MSRMAGVRLDQGLPLTTSVLPPFGGCKQCRKCTISVSEREAPGIIGCVQSACRSPRAGPFRSARGAESKLMSIKNARLGFVRTTEHLKKAREFRAQSHG